MTEPTTDEALVEAVARAIHSHFSSVPFDETFVGVRRNMRSTALDALAAARPAIEAAERERCAKVAENHDAWPQEGANIAQAIRNLP